MLHGTFGALENNTQTFFMKIKKIREQKRFVYAQKFCSFWHIFFWLWCKLLEKFA